MGQWNPNVSHLCGFCEVPYDETMDHLFLKGEAADSVWRYFASAAGLLGPWVQVKQVLLKWWDAKDFIKLKFKFPNIPNNWPQMVALLDSFRPSFTSREVRWSPPPLGWWKCNTDGASRGNSGPSTIAFCVRDSSGDLVGAKGLRIQDTTNITAEAMALKEGRTFECKQFQDIPVAGINLGYALAHWLVKERLLHRKSGLDRAVVEEVYS
ncbi:hypothetical protein KY289_000870 [Solanum tuberosum]|nr:hypothetical protein KY289_000870 [Solanum tuberosum]